MAYKVYLADMLGDGVPDINVKVAINVILQGYFNAVASKTSHGSALVHWLAYYPTVPDHELLIYFMPSGHSVVSLMQGKALSGTLAFGSHWGFTQTINGKTASEVYSRTNDAKVLANLAFHEAMHNKLQLGNRALHNGDGMRGSAFRSQADVGGEVSDTTLLTAANVSAMANALNNSVPQWTDGITELVKRRLRKESGDPLWDV